MTSKRFVVALLGSFVAIPAAAQQGQQPPATVAAYVRNAYMGNKNNILRSAEKMPEEFYGLRPGPQEEVRTFGQHLAHVANFNFLWCSQAKGEKNPNAGINFEKTLIFLTSNLGARDMMREVQPDIGFQPGHERRSPADIAGRQRCRCDGRVCIALRHVRALLVCVCGVQQRADPCYKGFKCSRIRARILPGCDG